MLASLSVMVLHLALALPPSLPLSLSVICFFCTHVFSASFSLHTHSIVLHSHFPPLLCFISNLVYHLLIGGEVWK